MPPGHQTQPKPAAPVHKPAGPSPDKPTLDNEQVEAPAITYQRLGSVGSPPPLSPKDVRALQRHLGNRSVCRLIDRRRHAAPARAALQRAPVEGVIQRSVTVGGIELVTHNQVVSYVRLRRLQLQQQRSELSGEGVASPSELEEAISSSSGLESWCASGGEQEIDGLTERMITDWHDLFIEGFNAAEAAKAQVSARRLAEAQERVEAAVETLQERILPALRERQRSAFRQDSSSTLLSISDTIATVLDTTLSCRSAIEAIAGEREALGTFVNTALVMSGQSPLANNRAAGVMRILDQVNRAYAGFQLVRAGLDLITGHSTTEAGRGLGQVRAVTSAYGAAGTLLGVSAGVSAYSTFYLAPMVDAAITIVSQYFDIVSRTENRRHIEAGFFDLVDWSLEPGGRAMFNFMLRVMQAGGPEGVPTPVPRMVADYFVENQSNFEAGSRGRDMPTTGWWFWEDLDQSQIASWAFSNRQNLWGMLYGDCRVPRGEFRA